MVARDESAQGAHRRTAGTPHRAAAAIARPGAEFPSPLDVTLWRSQLYGRPDPATGADPARPRLWETSGRGALPRCTEQTSTSWDDVLGGDNHCAHALRFIAASQLEL